MTHFSHKRGDTLIEVLFAVAIFAALMIAGLAIMNAGIARGLHTMQLTMARNQIDAQAEALRFLNSSYISQYPNIDNTTIAGKWNEVVSGRSTGVRASDPTVCKTNFSSRNDIIIDTRKMKVFNRDRLRPATTFPQLVYNNTQDTNVLNNDDNFSYSEGLWIEVIPSNTRDYYDFHIRACWQASGNSVPTTIGTIVRLYVPKG